ncbi:MAG: hypothetical protein IT462_15880 [Planctomycetes bacterium]|nr:hypothetical protein [Planctomycetota bacterium]
MPLDSAKSDPFENLREQLSRADRVLGFARKLKHDSGAVPPGLSQDFSQARSGIEKEFVRVHADLPPNVRERLKEFLIRTRSLDSAGVDQNLDKLARRARSLLNELVINGASAELTEEHFSEDLLTSPPSKRADAGKPVDTAEPPPASTANMKPLWLALAAVGALAVLTLALVVSGVFSPQPLPNIVANVEPPKPDDGRKSGPPKDGVKPAVNFDAKGAGYGAKFGVQPLALLIDPLEMDALSLAPSDLPALQMGLESLVHVIEPGRLRMAPEQTGETMRGFAQSVVDNEKNWIVDRKPLIEAFVGHAQKNLQFSVYPQGEQWLVSDFLSDKGAPRAAALTALAALGRTAGCPLEIIAPTSPEFAMLALQIPAGTATYDGEAFAQRPLPEAAVPMMRLFSLQLASLRPTLKTPGARIVVSAVMLRANSALTLPQCREALADLSDELFADAPEGEKPEHVRARTIKTAAVALVQYLVPTLLASDVGGDAGEALKLWRFAAAARLENLAGEALIEVGKRAAKGALIDGLPVMLVVGDLTRKKGDLAGATSYYERARDEFPDDPRALLRLAEIAADDAARLPLLREAYARGERGPDFLRELARVLTAQGENLSALAIFDDLCALPECQLDDVLNQAAACIALDKPDWAQSRLAAAERFKDEPQVCRLDLILELSVNGASERARKLAKAYAERTNDAYVANLLMRFGIE